jgi:hypothetical protein
MAKHEKDRAKKKAKKSSGIRGAGKAAVDAAHKVDGHPGGHAAAKAHGQPATVDESLPGTREELLDRHAEARGKRAAATLGSDAYRIAADEIGRIEIRIAAVERAMTPPQG